MDIDKIKKPRGRPRLSDEEKKLKYEAYKEHMKEYMREQRTKDPEKFKERDKKHRQKRQKEFELNPEKQEAHKLKYNLYHKNYNKIMYDAIKILRHTDQFKDVIRQVKLESPDYSILQE
jgi:hypothetical protein